MAHLPFTSVDTRRELDFPTTSLRQTPTVTADTLSDLCSFFFIEVHGPSGTFNAGLNVKRCYQTHTREACDYADSATV